jgi:hypothetical protein
VVGVEFRDGFVAQFLSGGGVEDIGESDVGSDNGLVCGESCAAVYFGDGEPGWQRGPVGCRLGQRGVVEEDGELCRSDGRVDGIGLG